MSKILGKKDNFRVEVTPRGLGDFGSVSCSPSLFYGRGKDAEARMERDMVERCEEIAKAIKRHVDDVYSAYVVFDQPHVCSHCGAFWTEDSSDYNGGCCAEDEDNNPNSEAA